MLEFIQQITKRVVYLFPLVIFGLLLKLEIPKEITIFFFQNSSLLFFSLLILFYLAFLLPEKYQILAFGLILVIFAFSLSYKWTSGYSDNKVIAGLLPYKDGRSYFDGAMLILDGESLNVGRSTWRPLFPAFLSSVLWVTRQNLQLTMAVSVALVGYGIYLSARELANEWGALPASLYTVLLYIYIQYFVGITASELLGLATGCIAFYLLVRASSFPKWLDVILGLSMLMFSISARAGAFFVFPVIILWVGLVFRKKKRFSINAAIVAFVSLLAVFLLSNSILRMFIGAETGSSFANFSYSLYGQVRGGTGWHSAIEDLGTRDSSKIYKAAYDFFLEHPLSFFIAAFKSFRDFFLPGSIGVFPFNLYGKQGFLGYILWCGCLALLAIGLIKAGRSFQNNISSLLIAVFIGIFLSIPFLPPIDGGSRFYASTMPFFFGLVVAGFGKFPLMKYKQEESSENPWSVIYVARIISLLLLIFAIPFPIMNRYFQQTEHLEIPKCVNGNEAYAISVNRGSYVEIQKKGDQCGLMPNICLEDFDKNGKEKGIDDFYDQLLSFAEQSKNGIRVIPTYNMVDLKSYYFVQDLEHSITITNSQINMVCGYEHFTKNQRIFKIEKNFVTD